MKLAQLRHLFAIGLVAGAFAQQPVADKAVPEHQLSQQVEQKYGIKKVDAAPAGVAPFRFGSYREVSEFLDIVGNAGDTVITTTETAPKTSARAGTNYANVRRTCSTNAGMATVVVTADIRVGRSGSFGWIDSVSTRVHMQGVGLGLVFKNEWSNHHIVGGSKVDVRGGGLVEAYLIAELGGNGILLWSTPKECSFSYSIY